jgi:hypothetical protein
VEKTRELVLSRLAELDARSRLFTLSELRDKDSEAVPEKIRAVVRELQDAGLLRPANHDYLWISQELHDRLARRRRGSGS